ncbi:MAG: hypothetical protein WCJ66_12655 [Verrucomicrobiota bacterium]
MSATPKKTTTKGIRYTDAQKQEVITFANKWNADKGRGGQAEAARRFGISVLTVAGWIKAGSEPKAAKAAAPAPAKAPKVVKIVKVTKASKAAKATATPAVKQDAPQGKRYTDAQKQEVVSYVLEVNTAKGRGGLSAAVAKYKVSPLTISGWIKKAGMVTKAPKAAKAPKTPKAVKPAAPAKVAKVKAPATGGLSAKAAVAIGNQVAKLEKQLAKLKLTLGKL